jgi:flagellar basal body-associated protein FliL
LQKADRKGAEEEMKTFLKILLISVICSLVCSFVIGMMVVNELHEIIEDPAEEENENPKVIFPKEWLV